MVEPLPKWAMKSYADFYAKFGNDKFTFKQASSLINDKNKLSVTINKLKRSGWIKVEINETDSRKRDYFLINPVDAIKEIAKGGKK